MEWKDIAMNREWLYRKERYSESYKQDKSNKGK